MDSTLFASKPTTRRLTWSLVIATYKRDHILLRCLTFAAAQRRQPVEIIVVDASPNWGDTQRVIMQSLAASHINIRWIYVQAERASSASQRNQGAALATSDVLFFIYDDSFMYPECAEATMEVYELDTNQQIAGVGAVLVDGPPGVEAPASLRLTRKRPYFNPFRGMKRKIRDLLRADDIFVPYDKGFPDHCVGANVDVPYIRTRLLSGCRASFRRHLFQQEPFENILERYALGEDSDMSYRVSRRGALVIALQAKIHHLQIHGGRLSPRLVTAFGAMNAAVLLRIHSTQSQSVSKIRYRRLLFRRLAIQFLKDLSKWRWSFPHARGIWHAIRMQGRIFCRTEQELREWYPQYQQSLIAREVS